MSDKKIGVGIYVILSYSSLRKSLHWNICDICAQFYFKFEHFMLLSTDINLNVIYLRKSQMPIMHGPQH